MCGVYFVIICSSSLLLVVLGKAVVHDCCISWVSLLTFLEHSADQGNLQKKNKKPALSVTKAQSLKVRLLI